MRDRIFYEGDVACTIHMAARIVVPESVERPYEYYRDNEAKSLEPFDPLVHGDGGYAIRGRSD